MKKNEKKRTSILIIGMLTIAVATISFCGEYLSNHDEDLSLSEPCHHENRIEMGSCTGLGEKALLSITNELQNVKIVSNLFINELVENIPASKNFSKYEQNFNYFPSYNNNLKSVVIVI